MLRFAVSALALTLTTIASRPARADACRIRPGYLEGLSMLAKYIHKANADYRRHSATDSTQARCGPKPNTIAPSPSSTILSTKSGKTIPILWPTWRKLWHLQSRRRKPSCAHSGSHRLRDPILSGKRDLNVRQIGRLAGRFCVFPPAFHTGLPPNDVPPVEGGESKRQINSNSRRYSGLRISHC